MNLKVATHNVCHMGMNPIDRSELFDGDTYRNGYPAEIIEMMRREWKNAYSLFDSDIIGIQEYFPWFDLARTIRAEDEVFKPLGMNVEYAGRNLALATKFPFRKEYQDTFDGISPRQKEKFTVDVGGREIAVFNCHPTPKAGNENIRALEYEKLIEIFSKEDTFIAFGDFNAQTPAEFEPFLKAGFNMANTGIVTEEKGRTTDNIIVSGNIKLTGVKTFDKEFVLSDHAILWAELELD